MWRQSRKKVLNKLGVEAGNSDFIRFFESRTARRRIAMEAFSWGKTGASGLQQRLKSRIKSSKLSVGGRLYNLKLKTQFFATENTR